MTIQPGNLMPSGDLTQVGKDGPEIVSADDLFANKRVIMFGLPGAFTPTCSEAHLPGYAKHFDLFKAKGIDTVACLTVNDHFVVAAWARFLNIDGITLLADGNADYVTALGMNVDMSDRGFGVRSARFALLAENKSVTHVAREATPKDHGVSSAESIFAILN